MNFLTEIHENKKIQAVHMSENGFMTLTERAELEYHTFRNDSMSNQDLPKFQLMQEIIDVFDIPLKYIFQNPILFQK